MKFCFVVSFLVFMTAISQAQQLDLVNEDVLYPDSLVLFNGPINHFRLTGEDDLHSYGLSIKNGIVTYTGNGTFLVRNLSNQPVQISVFRQEDGTDRQQILFTRIYQVQDIGTASVQLIREDDETLSNRQVMNRTRLEVVFPNKNYNGPSEIAHFELTAIQADSHKLFDQLFVSGKFLGTSLTNALKKMRKGGRLQFTQVILYTKDDHYEKLADFSVRY